MMLQHCLWPYLTYCIWVTLPRTPSPAFQAHYPWPAAPQRSPASSPWLSKTPYSHPRALLLLFPSRKTVPQTHHPLLSFLLLSSSCSLPELRESLVAGLPANTLGPLPSFPRRAAEVIISTLYSLSPCPLNSLPQTLTFNIVLGSTMWLCLS